jgi:hypothetical protein
MLAMQILQDLTELDAYIKHLMDGKERRLSFQITFQRLSSNIIEGEKPGAPAGGMISQARNTCMTKMGNHCHFTPVTLSGSPAAASRKAPVAKLLHGNYLVVIKCILRSKNIAKTAFSYLIKEVVAAEE